MATQAALIADTIVGMKRALRRERDGKTLIFPRSPFFALLFVKQRSIANQNLLGLQSQVQMIPSRSPLIVVTKCMPMRSMLVKVLWDISMVKSSIKRCVMEKLLIS